MKQIMLALLVGIGTSIVYANEKGNGGDICELRFKTVREDIHSWVLNGGAAGLTLPNGLSRDQFNLGMLNAITKATTSCTDDVIIVNSAEKTCRNYFNGAGQPQILCNVKRFLATAEADQYLLVHHEYAGVAGFEINRGAESDYTISSQITGFLENQVVKKLVVKPPQTSKFPIDLPKQCSGPDSTEEEILNLFQPGETTHRFQTYGVDTLKVLSRECRLTGCTPWSELNNRLVTPYGGSHMYFYDGGLFVGIGNNHPYLGFKYHFSGSSWLPNTAPDLTILNCGAIIPGGKNNCGGLNNVFVQTLNREKQYPDYWEYYPDVSLTGVVKKGCVELHGTKEITTVDSLGNILTRQYVWQTYATF